MADILIALAIDAVGTASGYGSCTSMTETLLDSSELCGMTYY